MTQQEKEKLDPRSPMSTDGTTNELKKSNNFFFSEYVPRSRKRRKQMMEDSELERAAVKYDEAQKNRVWY